MKTFSLKQALPFLISLGGAVLVLTAYWFLVAHILSTVEQESVLADTARTALDKDADARKLDTVLTNTKEDRTALDAFVVSQNGVAELLEQLEKIGAEERAPLSVVSVNLRSKEGVEFHEFIDITFTVRGSFATVGRVLSRIESFPIPVSISRSYLERETDNRWVGSFTASVPKIK